jgi:hypothetical protein
VEFSATAKSDRPYLPGLPAAGEVPPEMGDAKLAGRNGRDDASCAVIEWDGMERGKRARQNGRSIIDCPGNCGLVETAEQERCRMAKYVRRGTEPPREAPQHGSVDVASKNGISKTQERSLA